MNTVNGPLASRVFWNAVASLLGSIGRLVAGVLVARLLGPEFMGRFSYALWMVEVTVLLVTLGLPNALTRYLANYQGLGDSIAQVRLVRWCVLVYAVITLLACGVIYFFAQRVLFPDLDGALAFAVALLLAAQLWAGLNQAVITGLQDFKTMAKLTAASTLVSVMGQSAGAAVWGIQGAIYGTTAAFGILAMAFVLLVYPRLKGATRTRHTILLPSPERGFYLYATNTWLAALISAIAWGRAELFFIERFSGHAEVGLFAVGLLWSSLVVQAIGLMASALMPHFSKLHGSGEGPRLKRDYRRLTVLAGLVAFPLAAGGAALMPELTTVVFGEAYSGAVAAARIMIATGLWSFAMVGSAAVYALGEAGLIMRWSVLGAALMVLGCLLLVPKYGAAGAATVRFLVQGTMVGIGVYLLRSRYGLPFPARTLGAIAMAASACALVARAVASSVNAAPLLTLALAVVMGAGVYVVSLRLFRVIAPEEVTSLVTLTERLPRALGGRLEKTIKWVAKA